MTHEPWKTATGPLLLPMMTSSLEHLPIEGTLTIPSPSTAQYYQQYTTRAEADLAQRPQTLYQSLSPLARDERTSNLASITSSLQQQHLSLAPFPGIGTYQQSHYRSFDSYNTYQPSQVISKPQSLVETATWSASSRLDTPNRLPAWTLMQPYTNTYDSMGLATASPLNGLRRQRSHQRTPSESTVASTVPPSPNNISSAHPRIANTDFEPDFSQTFAKDPLVVPDPSYLSTNFIPSHLQGSDMKSFAFDTNNVDGFSSPGSGSMPSLDHDSAITPDSTSDDADAKQPKNEERPFPSLALTRTESAVYQDELYNPAGMLKAATKLSKPKAPTSNAHRNLVTQRLDAANQFRAQSPTSAMSRERSPFRHGSQLAPAESWSPRSVASGPESRAQQRQEEREEAARSAIRRPNLQREPTKTISPKDAMLDYSESSGEPSLFQDSVPLGYKQHVGGEASVLTNTYLSQPQNTTFTLPPSSSQTSMAGFRAAGSADAFANANFNFTTPALPATTTATAAAMPNPFQMGAYSQMTHLTPFSASSAANMDTTPDFPAHLTSMESSISEGPPLSSQESNTLATLPRPVETRANTGTYTCTYHGCTQRFDSPASLQKHKRDYHRSQQHHRDNLSVKTASASPRSTESPGPTSNGGLTSAQILARNSQAGPHKCNRINPSTGKPCNTIFSRPYDLTRHEDTIHNGRKQKVRCQYCREEKTFSRNDALTRHMRVVHPDVDSYGKRGRRGD